MTLLDISSGLKLQAWPLTIGKFVSNRDHFGKPSPHNLCISRRPSPRVSQVLLTVKHAIISLKGTCFIIFMLAKIIFRENFLFLPFSGQESSESPKKPESKTKEASPALGKRVSMW